ncbi:SDR family oxidoreductase [Microbacterium gorillae]|uniref:SDR family oxidoreductase n=1 Tax=Microbacterium gorillae TaxID=1231063 RepID=UPI0005917478|nr:SDR family oxidoreductase [Microbacterium gorillae]
MDLAIAGRVALVTGGSSGIGRGIAEALTAEGVRVAVTSRDAAKARDAAEAIGGGARGYGFDSGDLDAVPGLVEAVRADLGELDIYIANTGGPPAGDPHSFSVAQWETANRTLVLSPLAVIEQVLPGMRERGFGRVVAIGSTSVMEPMDFIQLSNVYRPGLVNAFKVLARESAPDGVTFNHVHPGAILTNRLISTYASEDAATDGAKDIPARRFGTVAEIAAAAVFLCSQQASYISGTALLVDAASTKSV